MVARRPTMNMSTPRRAGGAPMERDDVRDDSRGWVLIVVWDIEKRAGARVYGMHETQDREPSHEPLVLGMAIAWA